jgi:ferredoxin-NADP reductase/predicted pyridoxine 5'-phosphate oxidase superfamily flavin-nucleotide-binding protein
MNETAGSPFHAGERTIQSRLGVRDRMERFGRQVIHDHMPKQHRAFYAQLPFVLVGHADPLGRPWASILVNPPGFISSPDARTLDIDARPLADDPLAEDLLPGTRIGLLGIELHTRRRNRLAARINAVDGGGISLSVDQAFGNCPQYIQTRELEFVDTAQRASRGSEDIHAFDGRAHGMIESADTFFVASCVDDRSGAASNGVDVSHRGGRPGFVRIDDERTLTVPDYSGNFHFNTLGNFLLNPRAGLLFVDFRSGDLLMLTGTVAILWDDPDTQFFAGAERLWRFTLDQGRHLRSALPLRGTFGDYSPNSLLTGTWAEAEAQREARAQRDAWRDYRVVRIEDESAVIRSFYLEPLDGAAASFQAGQFLTVRLPVEGQSLQRTYTVSSAPADAAYRISVKREPAGLVSKYLHDHARTGDTLQARAPLGAFTFDAAETRPAVLLCAGVGITPMVSMLRHAIHEAVRTRHLRRIVFIHSASDAGTRAFFDEVSALTEQAMEHIRFYSALGRPAPGLVPGKDFHHAGRVSKTFLQSVLVLDDYDYYLCGPAGFMRAMYATLRELGARDERIFAESFGPASLPRWPDADATAAPRLEQAGEAVVEFNDSAFEQPWTPQAGTLLELAEAHGLSPPYGCRHGECGACTTRLVSGKVTYRCAPRAERAGDEVFLCCAVPAAAEGDAVPRVVLAL